VKRLHDKGSVTEQKLDHIKAEYDAAKAKAKMLEQSTKIRAPFSGVVTGFLLEEGENYMFSPNLEPGYSMTSGIVQLMKLNPLEVHFDVNERDLRHLTPGQEIRIELMAFPDTVFQGEVYRTPDVLSTATRSGKVTARLPNPKHMVKPGMSADVTVFTSPDSVIFVPLESVFRPQGTDDDYVYQVINNKVERRKVKRIATVDDRVAVKGLPENTQVVIAGKDGLEEGSRVIVKNK
jgi:membrane fusion protein (multidrug efflux system)